MEVVELKKLKDKELHEATLCLVHEERRISVRVLEHLREIELRRVYVGMGYSSLFDYCMRELKYSDSQSYRRIASMRLMKELPVLKEKIESGSLNVSTLTKAVGVFRAKAKIEKVSTEAKLELLQSLENKSSKQVETMLTQVVSKTHTQITLQMSEELKEKLKKVRDFSAHHNVGAGLESLIEFMADQLIKKLDPTLKKTRVKKDTRANQTVALTKVNVTETRNPSSTQRKQIWQDYQSKCHFKNCGSTYALEIDHIKPYALDGKTTLTNLRLLCRTHNQYRAKQTFG